MGAFTGLAIVSFALSASANGRFPRSQQLIETPGDPTRLILRTTFGILLSVDAGDSWRVICEGSVGYGGMVDPAIGVTADGTLLAGVFGGLRVSRDDGCQFEFAQPGPTNVVADVTVEKQDTSKSLVLISEGLGQGRFQNELWESVDAGRTWNQRASALGDRFLGLTLDPAPSNPDRLYVSGQGEQGGEFLRSEDRGGTWESVPVPNTEAQASPFIGAVHPANADMVFVRVSGFENRGNDKLANDALLVTTDGGDSFMEVHRRPAKMMGFALHPDGSEVLIGYGNPIDGTVVEAEALGIWKASTSDFVFEKIFDGSTTCLTWSPRGLYVCASQFSSGFELGFANGADFTLQDVGAVRTIMQLSDAEGVVECPLGTTSGDLCPAAWPGICQDIGRCLPDGMDAGGPDGGDGGNHLDAGPPGDAAPSRSARGSSCRAAPEAPSSGYLWLLTLVGLVRWRGARR